MSKIKTRQLGMGASLVIVLLAFGAFASAAALITKNQFSLAPFTWADENDDEEEDEDEKEEDEDEGEDEDEDEDEEVEEAKKKAERERENAKKQAERERENAKKQAERARESAKKQGEKSGKGMGGNELDDHDEENEIDDDEGDDVDEDKNGDNHGMFKDRDKTLAKLQKEIDETRKEILEKQAEGVDVSAALARLALAEAGIIQVGSSFDANDLEAAKMLAKQIKKTAHFAKEDLHDAKEIAQELAKIEKRFGQVEEKLAVLQSLGGDTAAFRSRLATLRADFSALRTAATTQGAVTRDTLKAFEKQVKRLKSLVESTLFALGSTDDDDLFEDHEEDTDDFLEDLDDVAEIEEDDDSGVSGKMRALAAEHKLASRAIKESLADIKGRDGLTRTLFGSDSDAVNALNQQVAAMNTRAIVLDATAAQITDPDIKQVLTDQADALRSEVMKLQSYISTEKNVRGLFGWLTDLF